MRSSLVSLLSLSVRRCRHRLFRSIFFLWSVAAVSTPFSPALWAQNLSYAGAQSVLPTAGLSQPTGVAIDGAGNRYIIEDLLSNVIEITANGTQSTISLNSSLDAPRAITVDNAGNLYIADYSNGRVVKVAISAGNGTVTTLASSVVPVSIAVDSVGNVYFVDQSNGHVIRIAAVGGAQTEITGASFAGAVAVDTYGNVYIADTGDDCLVKVPAGATSGSNLFCRLVSAANGLAVDKFGNIFASTPSGLLAEYGTSVRFLGGGFDLPAAIAVDGAGNVYLVDFTLNQIDIVAPGAVDIGQANVCPDSGTQTPPCSQSMTLHFNVRGGRRSISSVAIRVSTQGGENLDFTETANTCTGNFNSDTTCSVTVQFKPTAPGVRLGAVDVVGVVGPSEGAIPQPGGQRPRANFVLPKGAEELATVYVHGLANAALANFDAGTIHTLPVALPAGDFLTGVTTDSAGNLYVADASDCVISGFTPNGTSVVLAGDGSCKGTSGDGGLATDATFRKVWRVAVNSRGDLYIPDYANAVIRKVDAITGVITTIAGSPGVVAHTPDGVPAASATLSQPFAPAVDGAGNLFFTDLQENTVRRIDASSGILTTVAGNYASGVGFSGDGGPATSAQMHAPDGLAIDAAGNLYIADYQNNVIRKVTASTGVITTVAGQGPPVSPGYSGDGGPATGALINDPEGVALDVAGNIYIADANNLVIRKVNVQTGIITTAAGVFNGGTELYTGDGGPATLAGLSYLEDVALDSAGNFYIADSDNGVVRKVTAASASASFGSFSVGTSSPAVDVTLINDGNAALDLSALAPPINFNLSGSSTSCSTSSSLAPGGTCILGIEFLPTVAGSLTGTITVTDNAENNPASTQSVALSGTGLAATADKLAITGVAATVAAGGNLGSIQVSVESNGGAIVTGSTASITLTITGPNEFSHTLTVAAVNGIANFNLSSLVFTSDGSYTVTATSSGLAQAEVPFAVSGTLQPAKLALPAIPATVDVGNSLGTVPVSVETSSGAVAIGSTASITVTITGPNGYSQQVTAVAVNGIAAFNLTSLLFSTAGSYTITATSGQLTQASASFTVTASAAQAAKLALPTIPAVIAVDENLGIVPVSVQTSGGSVVTNSSAPVTVTVTNPRGFSQVFSATAVNGIAIVDASGLKLSVDGSYTITATSIGLQSASASFTVTASTADAAKLVLSTIPAIVGQHASLGTVQVSVETNGGTVATGSIASITLTISGPNGYSQTLTVAAVNGVATFDVTAFSFATLGNYTVTANSTGLTLALAAFIVEQDFTLTPTSGGVSTTPTQDVLPGAAAVYQLQLAPAGTTFNGPITLSATGLPPGATYTFAPAVVTPGSAAATTTFTVNTAKTTSSLRRLENTPWEFTALLPALFLLPWANTPGRRRKARWFRVLPLLLLGLWLGIAGLSGCGAGGLFSHPQNTYTITVTGTSGSFTHSTTVKLIVQ